MGDTFHRIDDRASEVIGRVDLPLGAGTVVRSRVAAVDDRVTHGLIRAIEGNLSTNTPANTLRGAVLHLLKARQALLDGKVTTAARKTVETLSGHSLLIGVISIGVALLDDLDTEVVQLVEVVTGIGHLVRLDTHKGKVLHDGVLELFLLVRGVGVVESITDRLV
jgi:hypothetical protein